MQGLINANDPTGSFRDESLLDYMECDTNNASASGKVIFRKYSEGEASIEFRDIKAINTSFVGPVLMYSGYDRFLPISPTIHLLLTYVNASTYGSITQSYLQLPARGTNGMIRVTPIGVSADLMQIPNIIIRYRID